MIFIFIVCFVSILVVYLISTMIKPSNFPPGPSRLPVIGNTFLIKNLSRQLGGQYMALLKLSEEFKTDILGLKLGSNQYVVVFGRKLIQQLYTRDEFQGRPNDFFVRLRTMGTRKGITMTDGPLWLEQRNFVERHLRQLGLGKEIMENLIKQEISDFVSTLGDRQEHVSLNEKLSTAVLNILWTIIGGKQFSKEDKVSELLSLLKERSAAFDMAGGLLNQIPWLRFICPEYSGYNMIQSLNMKLYSLFQEIINKHKKTLTSETRDFIDAYLHEKQSSKSENFTDDQLIAICLDLFIAGALTTSYTLDFAILATVRHPRIQQKLHEEIDKLLQRRKQMPSLADKSKLPYVEAVLLESQRFQHVVPTAGPRRVLKNTTLGGYKIPKNTIILMSLRSIHYDKKRWTDPEIFRPERFLNEKGELIMDEGLCTFGLGKRRCLGEVLARNFVFLSFTTLFHFYKISFPKGKEPPSRIPAAGILLSPQPYTISLQARH